MAARAAVESRRMRAILRRCQGAVVGKALTGANAEGTVLALVMGSGGPSVVSAAHDDETESLRVRIDGLEKRLEALEAAQRQ